MDRTFFCVIGAQRSGSTYLYRMLDEHPEILMARPMRPEPKFFLDESAYQRGREHYMARYFSGLGAHQAFGEKSTSYLEVPAAGERIQHLFPQAHVLVILRHPVERALSNFAFSVMNGLEPRSLEEVFLQGSPRPAASRTTSVSPFDYIERGHYQDHLPSYLSRFGSRAHVLIFEETVGDARALSSVYRQLNVDPTFRPSSISEVVGSSQDLRDDPAWMEVVRRLTTIFGPSIAAVEALLGRRIPPWHDQVQ